MIEAMVAAETKRVLERLIQSGAPLEGSLPGCECRHCQDLRHEQTLAESVEKMRKVMTERERDDDGAWCECVDPAETASVAYALGFQIGAFRAGLVDGGGIDAVMSEDHLNYLTQHFADRLLDLVFGEGE